MISSIPDNLIPVVAAIAAFLFMIPFTPLVIKFAYRMNWVARPKIDRWHSRTTALMGGIAIFAAAMAAAVLSLGAHLPLWLMAGATVMFFAGLWDDIRHMKPAAKVLMQILATSMLMFGGFYFGGTWPLWLSVPLTFLWVIGITNALNLLDNMDGLASGVTAIAAAVLAALALMEGNLVAGALAMAVAGAAGGFLLFNRKPARIFMGDSGSLFLGYMVASLALIVQGEVGSAGVFAVLLVPVAVMAVPIFDTTLVTISRLASGRRVSQGGRDHSSHRLVFLGLSERNAVLALYGISFLFGLIALTFHLIEVRLFYSVVIYTIVALGVIGAFLAGIDVYEGGPTNGVGSPESASQSHRVALRAVLMHKRTIAMVMADLLLVIACYLLAHTLRFEDGLTGAREYAMYQTLPWVVVAKMVVFYFSGLYRSWWRHAGTPEVVRIGMASVAASFFAFGIIYVGFQFEPLSRSVFVIDWFLTLFCIAAVRFVFRGIPQYLAARHGNGRPVLLYGAGAAGILSLREIRANEKLDMDPVGFLDDDREKQGLMIQGLPVLGSLKDLAHACRVHGVQEVLITTTKLTDARKRDFYGQCREMGIGCREFYFAFEDMVDLNGSPTYVRSERGGKLKV